MKKFSAVSSYQKSRSLKVQEKRINFFHVLPFAIINQVTPLAWVTCAAQWNLSAIFLADRADRIYSEWEAESVLAI